MASAKRTISDTEPESSWEDFDNYEEPNAKDSEGRFWCMTIHKDENGEYSNFPATVGQLLKTQRGTKHIMYLVYQEERCPKTERCHLQLFMITKEKVKHSTLRGLFPKHYIAMRYKKSTNEEAAMYCKKKDTATGKHVYEGGTFEEDKSGKRQDLEDLYEAALNQEVLAAVVGKSFNNFKTYVKFHAGVEKAFQMLQKEDDDRVCELILLTGPTNSGKTTFVKEFLKRTGYSAYQPRSNNGGAYSFETYDRQQVIWIEELSSCTGPGAQLSAASLLKLCDNGRVVLPGRNMSKAAHHGLVMITSNMEPDQWGLHPDHLQAFLRRLTYWVHCDYDAWEMKQQAPETLPAWVEASWIKDELNCKMHNWAEMMTGHKFTKPAIRSLPSTSRGFILHPTALARQHEREAQERSQSSSEAEQSSISLISDDEEDVPLRRHSDNDDDEYDFALTNEEIAKALPGIYDEPESQSQTF